MRAERQRAEEAARDVDRLRLLKLEQERIARETAVRLEREVREMAAETAHQCENLRQQQLAIQAEQGRARLAEEQRQKEIAEQQRIEAKRATEARRARQRKKEENECIIL